jgi:Fe-S-cluster containining protein
MKNVLGISSSEFLEKYTVPLILEENQLPLVLLRMQEDEEKKCPFVSDEGCTIYRDRPWSCRMYPLGLASSKTESGQGEEFCFVVEEKDALCQGFKEDREQTVEEWFEGQDVNIYNRKSASFMQLTMNPYFQKKEQSNEKKLKAFFRTSYDLDGFREMLFGSSFFDRFEISDELKEKLRTDDETLLEFGITKWLRFAILHEDTMILRDTELEKQAKSLGWKVETIEDLDEGDRS